MKIENLSYSHKASRWNLEKVPFAQLSLLVGLSGVGKTRILKGIQHMSSVASGGSLDGVTWEIEFTADQKKYLWKGEFESLGYSFRDIITQENIERPGQTKKPKVVREQIILEGNAIAYRTQDEVRFLNQPVPKLSADESLVKLLSEEELIKPISDGFKKVKLIDSESSEFPYFYDDEDPLEEVTTDEGIRDAYGSLLSKIRRSFELKTSLFDELRDRYIEIFPFVSDLIITPLQGVDVPRFMKDPMIHIKEKDVCDLVPLFRMSSGMVKTLFQLAAVIFSRNGSIFLIDEFENSLGANCVDLVTDFLIESSVDRQFIITSHHPYVINHVSPDYWSVVERRGGNVRVRSAHEVGIGSSRHKSYDQLMNTILFSNT